MAEVQDKLRNLREEIAKLSNSLFSPGKLRTLVDAALATDTPKGDPDVIARQASLYSRAGGALSGTHTDVQKVAKGKLPEVWVGHAGATAAEAVTAVSHTLDRASDLLYKGGRELQLLAEGIAEAQALADRGTGALEYAARMVADADFLALMPDEQFTAAKAAADDGLQDLITAADRAEEAGRRAGRELTKLSTEARTAKVSTDELSAVDKIVLADAAAAGGPAELNEILSAHELQRSAAFLEKMSDADQKRFDELLARSESPQERAYVMKALAAGYGIDDVETFADQIHPFGGDPQWLADHLTPMRIDSYDMSVDQLADNGQNKNLDRVTSNGAAWSQTGGTCVSTTTIGARAMVDPLYALRLTTGGHPGDPKYDSASAFSQRFLDEQHRLHTEGDGGENWSGMGPEGQERISDNEVGARSGTDYEPHDTSTAQARQDILDDVEQSVDEGKPVPFDVSGKDENGNTVAHAMMIVGHEGDKLQVYNPWGHTTWVSEDDFINGRMNKAADNRLTDVYSVYMPQ